MKTQLTKTYLSAFFFALLLTACESHEQKPDEAYKKVKWDKTQSEEAPAIIKATVPKTVQPAEIKKIDMPTEWQTYRIEMENRIKATEAKIEDIKATANLKAKDLKKLSVLEKSNNDLRNELNEFNREVKIQWESFKMEMAEVMGQIDTDLQELTPSDKK